MKETMAVNDKGLLRRGKGNDGDERLLRKNNRHWKWSPTTANDDQLLGNDWGGIKPMWIM